MPAENAVQIIFEWVDVVAGEGKSYQFPSAITPYLRRQFQKAGIYRWHIQRSDGVCMCYIGEAENVARRLNHYLCPGKRQLTNLRLKALLHTERSNNSAIRFQVARFEPFSINGCPLSDNTLTDPHVRKMVENLLIVVERSQGVLILNKGTDLLEKKKEELRELLSHLNAEEQDRILDLFRTLRERTAGTNGNKEMNAADAEKD